MAEVKCTDCDVVAEKSLEGWTHCEECDSKYCPKCSGRFREEKEKIERLKKGGPWERLEVLCPKCNSYLHNL